MSASNSLQLVQCSRIKILNVVRVAYVGNRMFSSLNPVSYGYRITDTNPLSTTTRKVFSRPTHVSKNTILSSSSTVNSLAKVNWVVPSRNFTLKRDYDFTAENLCYVNPKTRWVDYQRCSFPFINIYVSSMCAYKLYNLDPGTMNDYVYFGGILTSQILCLIALVLINQRDILRVYYHRRDDSYTAVTVKLLGGENKMNFNMDEVKYVNNAVKIRTVKTNIQREHFVDQKCDLRLIMEE